jgi:periplasmic copper chaperone A
MARKINMRLALLFLLPVLLLFGCRNNPGDNTDIDISIEISNESAAIGEPNPILVSLRDRAGNPINDAIVNLRGDMAHAGMSPVLAEATSGVNGVYEIPFAFTMSGDWVLTVDVTLADGSSASRSFNIDGIGGEAATEEAHNMGDTSVSAAYFSISNNSTEDIRLLSVTAEGIADATIHQTIVENDIARMEAVEEGLLIPAGETVELAPGSYHLMLMGLAQPLLEGETLVLNLAFDNNLVLVVEAPITMIPPDEGASAEAENILVSGAWLRPTAVSTNE